MTDQIPAMKGVIPYLNLRGAAEAIDFYKRAFGATEFARMPAEDGRRIIHGHLIINEGSLMISDIFPEHGFDWQPSTSFTMQLVVDDIDSWFKRAVDAGCTIGMDVQVMFWGDRYGTLTDPFGVNWAMNEPAKPAA
ncbi:MAG TPA: VOC family protein [Caulobacter sp.]|nr:VOC family protein [Caulobacter sp.]